MAEPLRLGLSELRGLGVPSEGWGASGGLGEVPEEQAIIWKAWTGPGRG